MSSRRSLGSTSSIRRSSSPRSWRSIVSRSFVRNSTRLPGVSRTRRVPSPWLWISGFIPPPDGAGCASGLHVLDQDRDALTAADAGRRDAAAQLLPAQLVHQRQDEAGAGGAERVAERDRPAVHVDLPAVELELLLAAQVLRRESLVDLDAVDVADRELRDVEAAPDGGHGPDAHLGRVDADVG